MIKNDAYSLVRLHLTNATGAGAVQLLKSLLPALEKNSEFIIEKLYLPSTGILATYKSRSKSTLIKRYYRFLPNLISRILECSLLARRFNGRSPLIVLGDLPLRCNSPQIVFIHQQNLIPPKKFNLTFENIKFLFARLLFKVNSKFVRAFIVQTEVMRKALEESYPCIIGRVHVVPQPAPDWLLSSGLRRYGRTGNTQRKLKLAYPAANYPHKNHSLLSHVSPSTKWPVEEIILTIEKNKNPAPYLSSLNCVGFLSEEEMIKLYSHIDALLFLSKKESFGFPLVEAIFIGLPIVCPDLPYARSLCGEQAIYFDPNIPESLEDALYTLQAKLGENWWPDWDLQRSSIPNNWKDVAMQILQIAAK